ncbi:MAG: folate family ECF transporter S component [Firmicutes bacterium]|nr:folate family ECF transporter S component [Bacillota bacterium]
MKKIAAQTLTRMALLIALNVILARVLSVRIPLGGVEGLRIGFSSVPVIFAGIFMGPLAGGIVGAIGDLIGFFISPIGAYMPHFTLNAALRGVIPGLVILLLSRGRRQIGIFPLFLAVCSTLIITDVFLLPFFFETLFGLSRVVTVPPRIIQNAISIPAYTVLLFTLGRAMEKVFAPGLGKEALHLSGKIW